MLGERYVVKKGDSLWKIAEGKLGSGTQWTRIWKYNNRAEVVRETGRKIPNPDLIYIGQVILIPSLPGARKVPLPGGNPPVPHITAQPDRPGYSSPLIDPLKPGPTGAAPSRPSQSRPTGNPPPAATPAPARPSGGGGTTLSERLRTETSPIAFKYKLDDLWFPPRDVGTAIIEMRLTGDVLLMTKKQYPVIYVTSRREIELQVTREANHAFGQLIEDNRFIYDPAKKQVTLRSMLVSQSNVPNTVATAIGVEMNTSTLTPKLRAEIRLPKLEGSIEPFRYVAMDVKVVIEITPKGRPPGPNYESPLVDQLRPIPVPVPVIRTTPVPPPAPQSGTNWQKVIGVGLVVVAGVVVVGTLVEDFFTAGAGTVDDPASFALAGASFTRGMAMIAGAAVVLPQAAVPANVQQKSSVKLQ